MVAPGMTNGVLSCGLLAAESADEVAQIASRRGPNGALPETRTPKPSKPQTPQPNLSARPRPKSESLPNRVPSDKGCPRLHPPSEAATAASFPSH